MVSCSSLFFFFFLLSVKSNLVVFVIIMYVLPFYVLILLIEFIAIEKANRIYKDFKANRFTIYEEKWTINEKGFFFF